MIETQELLTAYSVDEILMFLVLLVGAVISAIKAFEYLNDKMELVMTKKLKSRKFGERLDSLEESMDILLESDKSRIRGEIVREYRYFVRQGYIDAFTLDYLHHQFESYRKLGGNSYIEQVMDELDNLPLGKIVPPKDKSAYKGTEEGY